MTHDCLWLSIFLKNPEPICVVEPSHWKIVTANPSFETWTGYAESDFLENQVQLSNICYKKDLKNMMQRLQHSDGSQHLQQELRLTTKGGAIKDAEVTLQFFQREQLLLLMSFHDIGVYKEIEHDLREKIALHQQKRLANVQNIFTHQEFFERLRRMPAFCRELVQYKTLSEISAKAVEWLCSDYGLYYAAAAIFLGTR